MSQQALDVLRRIAADNGDAAAAIVALTTSWAEMSARLAILERQLMGAGGIASQALSRGAAAMEALAKRIEANEHALAEKHREIMKALSTAHQLGAKAETIMEDVLVLYDSFRKNTDEMKRNVAGLARAAIDTTIPGGGSLVEGYITRALGI